MALVVMVLIVVGLAYYPTEVKQVQRQTQVPMDTLHTIMSQYQLELMKALEGKVYSGNENFVNLTIEKLEEQANKTKHSLNATCIEGYSNYVFTMNCSITLSSDYENMTRDFVYNYSVPYEIRMYNDSSLSMETNYFERGRNVYYRITGIDNHTITINVSDPANLTQYLKNETLVNWQANGSFSTDFGDTPGLWTINLLDLNNSETFSKTIYMDMVEISIKTYDADWNEQDTFNKNGTVRYKIFVYDRFGLPYEVVVESTILNTLGKDAFLGERGKARNGEFNSSFIIPIQQAAGYMKVIATEHDYFRSVTKDILILDAPYERFLKLTPPRLVYTNTHTSAFAPSCGYTSWYSEVNTSYYNGTEDIPFNVSIVDENSTVRVEGTFRVFDSPNVHATQVHIFDSGCDDCV